MADRARAGERCPETWRGRAPFSSFDIDHRCRLDAHEGDLHACSCGASSGRAATDDGSQSGHVVDPCDRCEANASGRAQCCQWLVHRSAPLGPETAGASTVAHSGQAKPSSTSEGVRK